ncbi:MAG: HEAT repeat domain-containing protein [Thermodesulfobacteriota bacterium]|nr:HEAT repeat domain-containing protein [Thermodesulfobacteriota bacterium]
MTDDKHQRPDKSAQGTSAPAPDGGGAPLPDMQAVVQAVVALNICRKNVYSYPAEHDQIRQSLDHAFHALAPLLESRPGITLGITGESLIVELPPPSSDPAALPTMLPIDPSHAPCREFARILKQTNTATVTIASDIDMDALYRFLSILGRPAEDITANGGIQAMADEAELTGIHIRQVDYSRFHVTEEAEIKRDREDSGTEQHISQWEQFILRVMAGTPAASGENSAGRQAGTMPADRIARQINENRIDTDIAIDGFDRAMAGFLNTPSADSPDFDAGTWGKLIPALSPAVKPRFLSVLFSHLDRQAPSEQATQLLAAMPGEAVTEMFNNAAAESRKISPPLLALVRDMATKKNTWPEKEADILAAGRSHDETPASPPEDRSHPTKPAEKDESGVTNGFDLDDCLASLDDARLDIKIARLLTGFMNGNIGHGEYVIFAEKLIRICEELIEAGNFTIPATVLNTFAGHIKKKRDMAIREAAENAMKTLTGQAFAAKAVAGFLADEAAAGKAGVAFLIRLGPAIIPELVKRYAAQETPAVTESQETLFTRFAATASAEAQQRLDSSRPLVSRNLIVLIRTLGAREAVDRIRPFLHHDNRELQTEALETLLKFRDAVALSVVGKMIQARQPERALRGITMAGKHRVTQLVPELVVKLKRFVFFKKDIEINREIIHALAQIGAPEALPWLKKLAGTTWPLHAGEIARMKVTLFKSLKHYPPEAIQPLLTMGRDMRNKEISMVCHGLMQESIRRET